jgi:hypothetical protein
MLTLHLAGGEAPVSAVLTEITNSKGEPNVDDCGAPFSGGGLPHPSGMPRITVPGSDLCFAPGAEFGLQLKLRRAH